MTQPIYNKKRKMTTFVPYWGPTHFLICSLLKSNCTAPFFQASFSSINPRVKPLFSLTQNKENLDLLSSIFASL